MRIAQQFTACCANNVMVRPVGLPVKGQQDIFAA